MTKEFKQLLLGGLVVVAVVGVVVGVALYKKSTTPTPTQAIIRSTSHTTGNLQSTVTLVEFGDYQCPACGAVEPVIEQLRHDYADTVKFVFRNYPLTTIHPNAEISAEAAEAAAAQGKFWPMHDLLYKNQAEWVDASNPTDKLVGYAQQLGLDTSSFKNALSNGTYQSVVAADQKDGDALNIDATPTFFLNGQKIVGGEDYNTFKSKIDALLNAK